jgi:hypothetical protein
MQLSLFVVAFCAAGYIGLLIWSSMAMPAGSMSSYASPFAGGFPRDFGVIVGGLAFFLLLAITFLEKINPDIARKLKEEYRKTV